MLELGELTADGILVAEVIVETWMQIKDSWILPSVGNGKNGSGLYCIHPLTGKVFADERVLYKHVEKHGCINDQWDSEGVAVGKWHTAASAKVVGVIDGRKMSTVPDAPAPVPFIPRVTAEISAAESAKDALATAYEEHIAAVAKDPSLAEKTELMLLRAQNAALHAENLRHKEDNSLLRAVASSSHEMTLALKLNSERKTRQKTGHLAIHDAGDAVC